MERNIYKHFNLAKFRVIAELQELVQFIYIIEVSNKFAGHRLKIPASLYFDLIIPVCGQLHVIPNTIPESQAFVSPILHTYKDVIFQPGALLLGIRIRPEAFTELTRISASELIQHANQAEEIFDPALLQRILEVFNEPTLSLEQKIAGLQKMLVESWEIPRFGKIQEVRYILGAADDPEVHDAVELADRLGYSMRWLQIKTKHYLGLSPKQLMDMNRVSQFLQHPSINSKKVRLSEIGLSLGYYDQSHFIRSIKKISGESPSLLLKSDTDLVQHFA